MKRMLQFKSTPNGYACFESDENIFEISRKDLQFDVKAFYQAFYAEGKNFEDIEIENAIPDDRDGRRIYQCIEQLMEKIKEKLLEIPDEEGENSVE